MSSPDNRHSPASRTGDAELDQLFDLFNAQAEAAVTLPITAEDVIQTVLSEIDDRCRS